MDKKRAKKPNSKTNPPDTFGERIEPRPAPKQSPTPHLDQHDPPVYREHDEFGEWLLRDV